MGFSIKNIDQNPPAVKDPNPKRAQQQSLKNAHGSINSLSIAKIYTEDIEVLTDILTKIYPEFPDTLKYTVIPKWEKD